MVAAGDKYVIEIAEVFTGAESGQPKYRIKGFDNLCFDEKGLKKLKNFNEWYNYAHQDGYNDGYIAGINANVQSQDLYQKGYSAASTKCAKIIIDMAEAYSKEDN